MKPGWRNWQTRMIQVHVGIIPVRVQIPPSAPLFFEFAGGEFMPIYRYRCEKCGHEEQRLQSINSDPLEQCEVCGGKMRKQIGMIGIKFNGSCYYVTDTNSAKKTTTHPGTTSKEQTNSKKVKNDNSPKAKTEEKKAV